MRWLHYGVYLLQFHGLSVDPSLAVSVSVDGGRFGNWVRERERVTEKFTFCSSAWNTQLGKLFFFEFWFSSLALSSKNLFEIHKQMWQSAGQPFYESK